MNSTATRCGVYDSEAINKMGWAFDKAFEGLSAESQRQPNKRRDLALCIIRLFDEGENNRQRLSRMALATITIITASARKHISNEGFDRKLLAAQMSSGRPTLTL